MVRLLFSAAVLSVCMLLVTATDGAEKVKAINGKISKTELVAGKGTIEVTGGKKGEEKTTSVKVDTSTVVEKAGKKGEAAVKASSSDLQVGQGVSVTPGATAGAAASKIVIKGGKKGA